MGKASDEIRGEIEETRERMAETADAIRYRADVKTRTKEAVAEKKDSLVDKAGSAVSRVTGKMPSPETLPPKRATWRRMSAMRPAPQPHAWATHCLTLTR